MTISLTIDKQGKDHGLEQSDLKIIIKRRLR